MSVSEAIMVIFSREVYFTWVQLIHPTHPNHFLLIHIPRRIIRVTRITTTAQKKKSPMKDFPVNVTKSAGNCGFGHIY